MRKKRKRMVVLREKVHSPLFCVAGLYHSPREAELLARSQSSIKVQFTGEDAPVWIERAEYKIERVR